MRVPLLAALLIFALPAFGQSGSGVTVTGASFGSAGGGGTFSDVSCTDTVSCFCDCISSPGTPGTYANATCEAAGYARWSSATILLCEDFDNDAFDDGTGNAFSAVYPGADDNDCPNGPGSNDGDEGTDDDDCYNIVQDGACDGNATNTVTACALGRNSFGQKFDTTYTHGRHGNASFSNTSSIAATIVLKYGTGFYKSSGVKNDEWLTSEHGTEGWPLGQDTYVPCDSYQFKGCSGGCTAFEHNSPDYNTACTRDDLNHGTRIFWNCNEGGSGAPNNCPSTATGCTQTWIDNMTITQGIIGCSGQEWGWSAWKADYPGGSFSWPLGDWACSTVKVTGVGTTNATVVQTWMNQAGVEETVVQISGIDLSIGQHSRLKDGISFNNYNNGGDGTGSGYCTNAGGTGLGCDRNYRYEDNLVITNGDPVPCSIAMAPIIGS